MQSTEIAKQILNIAKKINSEMSDRDIQKLISKQLKGLKDKGFAMVLRNIIFQDNKINWKKAKDSIKKHMPEVKLD